MDTAQQQHHHHDHDHDHDHTHHNERPPSPAPPLPTARKRSRKKPPDDPFFTLDPASHHLLTSSPASSPTSAPPEPKDNLFIRLLWTPLLITSFLLSLSLINLSDRSRRLTSSSQSPRPSLLARLNPEPYQSPPDTTWNARNDGGAQGARKHSWHLHKKIRKMARLEIGDAFEMRGRVALGLCVLGLGVVGCIWWVGAWVWGVVRR